EVAVLVAGAAGNGCDVDLILVVLTGILERESELKRVISPYLRQAVRCRIDRTGGMGRIRTARQAVKVGNCDGRDFPLNIFALRKDVRIIDSESGTVEARRRLIHRNINIVQT